MSPRSSSIDSRPCSPGADPPIGTPGGCLIGSVVQDWRRHGTPAGEPTGRAGQNREGAHMSATPHSSAPDTYDVVVLGGGSGGYACALRAAQLGRRVALVESAKLGGTCLHWGCIPTKALLHAAELADAPREAARVGVRISSEGVDLDAVHAFKDGVITRLHRGLTGLIAGAGITVVAGTGRLRDARTVVVSPAEQGAPERVLTGEYIVLATGSQPRTLPAVPIGGPVMTSDEALQLAHLPQRAVVLGGGVIGVEFASLLTSFGVAVTVVEALPRLVPTEDEAISKALTRAFGKRGIEVRTGTMVSAVEPRDDGVRVLLDQGDPIETDLLLVAVGRGPRTVGLGYEEAGVRLDRGFVVTDERCRTSVPGVYAVGDIVPGLQLAHRGFAQGAFVAEDLAGLDPIPLDERTIPRVTYCEPEIASVGLTEEAARAAYPDVTVHEYNLGGNGRSLILGTTGFVKVVARGDGPVVGIHMLGSRIGEQIGEAQLIVGWEATPADVAGLVHAHPTQNEALGEAHLALAGKPLHSHA